MSTRTRTPRLSTTSYAVLGLVGYLQPCTPYELERFIRASIDNFWQVPHTTFYSEPARLAEAGLLEEERESGGRRRKRYSLTEDGRAALDAWVHSGTAAPPDVRDELLLKVFLGADPAPMLQQRIAWHEAKLAELRDRLEDVRHAPRNQPAMERSITVGMIYHNLGPQLFEPFLRPEPED